MDSGAPLGFRLSTRRPDRLDDLIVQNGTSDEQSQRDHSFGAGL
jgi:hypothetical protein